MMEEVVVTAQKKSVGESVQIVPISVTAFSGESLEAAQIRDLTDISASVPNTSITPNISIPNSATLTIRGFGAGSSIPSDDAPIGIFVDGVVQGVLHQSNIDAFDLESIEVLRGPQGTLFGRNVTAGAVLVRTARPSFESDTRFMLSGGSGGMLEVGARANATLVEDVIAGKLSVQYKELDGHFDNANADGPSTVLFGSTLSPSAEAGGYENILIRPSLRIQPDENLTIDIIPEYGSIEGDGQVWYGLRNSFTDPFLTGDTSSLPGPEPEDVNLSHNGLLDMEHVNVVVDANYSSNAGVFTSLTGFRDATTYQIFDADASSAVIWSGWMQNLKHEQFSQELRWAGMPFDNGLEITAGLYYFNQTIRYREARVITALVPVLGNNVLGGDVDHSTWAFYTNGAWRLSDTFNLNFGLRYTNETKKSNQLTGTVFDMAGETCDPTFENSCNFTFNGNKTWSNLSPAISFQWFAKDGLMVWGSVKRAFRSGGFNIRSSADPTIASPAYDEESVDAFELGAKFDISDSLRLNATVWHNTYGDLQISQLVNAVQVTRNAAEATRYGAEFELAWLVTDTLSIQANYGYVDGEWKNFEEGVAGGLNAGRRGIGSDGCRILDPGPQPAGPARCYGDLPLPPPLPDLTASEFNAVTVNHSMGASIVWDFPLPNSAYLTSRLRVSHVGDYRSQNLLEEFDAQQQYDASVSYHSKDNWSVTAYGKNLTNEKTRPTVTIDIGQFSWFRPDPPRSYGLEFRIGF